MLKKPHPVVENPLLVLDPIVGRTFHQRPSPYGSSLSLNLSNNNSNSLERHSTEKKKWGGCSKGESNPASSDQNDVHPATEADEILDRCKVAPVDKLPLLFKELIHSIESSPSTHPNVNVYRRAYYAYRHA